MVAFPKMTTADLVRYALICAINDRLAYADCWPAGTEERAEALDDVKQFRAYMKRRFSASQTPMEQAFEGVPSVSIHDILATPEPEGGAK
jgi:hypothetical protein